MSPDNNCSGQLLVELRIKAMQPELIPGPEQIHPALGVLDVGESTYQDQGSVAVK